MKATSILTMLAACAFIGTGGLYAHAEETVDPSMSTTISPETTITESMEVTTLPTSTSESLTTTMGMISSPGNDPDGEMNQEPDASSAVETGQISSPSVETQTTVSGSTENESPKTGVSGIGALTFGIAASLAAMYTCRKKK